MLNPHYRYVGIDFETTGLDVQKDSPIQIGIVEINTEGEIIDSFESLIRPQKDIKELKNIVKFITKIETAQLVFAPEISEITPQIEHFFGENVILIGHTINFDLAFLEKFFLGLPYYASFDTFQLAQALIPYAPSSALEVLMQHLEDKPLFLEWKTKFGLLPLQKGQGGDEELSAFHDAFYDTKATLALFCYLISYIKQIEEKYPTLTQLVKKSDTTLKEILNTEEEKLE